MYRSRAHRRGSCVPTTRRREHLVRTPRQHWRAPSRMWVGSWSLHPTPNFASLVTVPYGFDSKSALPLVGSTGRASVPAAATASSAYVPELGPGKAAKKPSQSLRNAFTPTYWRERHCIEHDQAFVWDVKERSATPTRRSPRPHVSTDTLAAPIISGRATPRTEVAVAFVPQGRPVRKLLDS